MALAGLGMLRSYLSRNVVRLLLVASLVPAYNQCTSPNRTHGPSLAHPSCNPPSQASDNVTVVPPGVAITSPLVVSMTDRRLLALRSRPAPKAVVEAQSVHIALLRTIDHRLLGRAPCCHLDAGPPVCGSDCLVETVRKGGRTGFCPRWRGMGAPARRTHRLNYCTNRVPIE